MKLIIDIHEEQYNDIKYYGTILDEDRDYIAECILNGIAQTDIIDKMEVVKNEIDAYGYDDDSVVVYEKMKRIIEGIKT